MGELRPGSEELHRQVTVLPSSVKDASYLVRLYFRVAVNTTFGQKVHVVGGWPRLGDWDPKKSLPLTTTEEVFPVWFSKEPVYVPLKVPVYYQYVTISEQSGEVVAWDSHPESRKVVPTGYEMTIEDDQGLYRTLTKGILSKVVSEMPPRISSQGNSRSSTQNLMRSPLFRTRDQQLGPPADTLKPQTTREDQTTPHQSAKETSDLSLFRVRRDATSEEQPPRNESELGEEEEVRSPSPSNNIPSVDAVEAIHRLNEIGGSVEMDPNDTHIVISFELPVRVTKIRSSSPPSIGDYEVSESNVSVKSTVCISLTQALVLPGLHKHRRASCCVTKFVGFCGLISEDEDERDIIRQVLEPHDCLPVFPKQDDFELLVDFCHKSLSPVFHGVADLNFRTQEPFNTASWLVYQLMNKLWADTALGLYNGDADLVWVHDFHLLLVPQFVARKYKRANIGFFLHVPFPPSEQFRTLPVREEILRSMLCSDLLGFHFFEYARHFFIATKRLLGLDQHFTLGGFLGIEYGGRNVIVKICHVNVEYNDLRSTICARQDIIELAMKLRLKHQNKFIFGAVDRFDQLAGLVLKFHSFGFFLKQFPYARERVVLIQYAYPTRMSAKETEKMTNELTMMANKINSEFGFSIDLQIQRVFPEDKYAILLAADCLLDTSIRDGLNLLAFEYIGCRRSQPSHMMLSEFTGCTRTIASAIRINPWQIDYVASAMDRVVNTSTDTIRERWARDNNYLSQHSLTKWAREFLCDLRRARKAGSKVYMQCGFASTFRVVSMNENFRTLISEDVIKAYRNAKRRMLFFDHEGTLAPDRRHLAGTAGHGHEALTAAGTPPSPAIKSALETLTRDSNNTVVIFSGRDQKLLEEWFGDVPDIGLCAEHGFYAKIPAVTGRQWHCMAESVDFEWKHIVLELMNQYARRTQGSFIENKGSAIVFQYRDADPDFGSWQAKELAGYLEEFLFGQPVTVITGKGYVEAKLRGVSKGVAVEHVLSSMATVFGEPQFVLCIGDDRTDEEMFKAVNNAMKTESLTSMPTSAGTLFKLGEELKTSPKPAEAPPPTYTFTVTVGKKPSAAHYFLNDTDEVSELLNALKHQSAQADGISFDTNAIVTGMLRASSSRCDSDLDPSLEADGRRLFSATEGAGDLWPGAESLGPFVNNSSNTVKDQKQQQIFLEDLCVD